MAIDLVERMEQRQGKKFSCVLDSGCDKSFTRKSDLQRHERIHTGERPYGCSHPNCRRRFRQQSALNVHSRTHTGEKPFTCMFAGCGKRFADSSSLSRHHKSNAHGGRTYRCKEVDCGKAFARKSSLRSHLERCHNTIHVVPSARPPQLHAHGVELNSWPESPAARPSKAVEIAQPLAIQPRQPVELADVPAKTITNNQIQGNASWMGQESSHDAWPMQSNSFTVNVGHFTGTSDYGAVVTTPAPNQVSQYPGSQNPQNVHDSNPSQMFVAERSNPGIATMNTDAIPMSYFTGNQPEYQHQSVTNVSGMAPSSVHQTRPQDYTGQDDTCMSATSSFHGYVEEECLSPHSSHSAATSFCEISSPNRTSHMDPHYYAPQIPRHIVPGPSSLAFEPFIMEAQQDSATDFSGPNYHCQQYL